jgi:hypothetical protein
MKTGLIATLSRCRGIKYHTFESLIQGPTLIVWRSWIHVAKKEQLHIAKKSSSKIKIKIKNIILGLVPKLRSL